MCTRSCTKKTDWAYSTHLLKFFRINLDKNQADFTISVSIIRTTIENQETIHSFSSVIVDKNFPRIGIVLER